MTGNGYTARTGSACPGGAQNRAVPANQTELPYIIVLDESNSVLNPGPGQRQRFCYQVSAVGSGDGRNRPLTQVILGVDERLTLNDFYNVSVAINGQQQTVIWGTNVELIPQNPAGCAGLRLSFPLRDNGGVMTICLTMNTQRPVGLVPVCLSDGAETEIGQTIDGPAPAQASSCPTTTYQEVDVCVPVTITPRAEVGEATVTCCGDPTITPGAAACAGPVGGTCSFTISQRVCVAVPVAFGADTAIGDFAVNCGAAGSGGCQGCEAAAEPAAALRTGGRTAACPCRRSGSTLPTGQTLLSDVIGGPNYRP